MRRICLIPNISGTGGMVSFRHKLTAGLTARGFEVCHDLADEPYQAVLIIGGTRALGALLRVKRRGVRLVQRLDGINWIQRKRWMGLRQLLRAEIGNLLQATIRRSLADRIIYQSSFARGWWQDWYGIPTAPSFVILNGVDLDFYTPEGELEQPQGRIRLLVVEGNLGGAYDLGLENAVGLAQAMSETHHLPLELMVVGQVSPGQQARWDGHSRLPIGWAGTVNRDSIPAIDRSAHLLFAADLHPACPNAVIEALACGLPVVGFDTGALCELVPADSGCIVPYGGNPWVLDKPDITALAEGASQLLEDLPRFRQAARAHAKIAFNLDEMVAKYLQVLVDETNT
jgi:glycosyltransferase involved in cell wall biosynthesis